MNCAQLARRSAWDLITARSWCGIKSAIRCSYTTRPAASWTWPSRLMASFFAIANSVKNLVKPLLIMLWRIATRPYWFPINPWVRKLLTQTACPISNGKHNRNCKPNRNWICRFKRNLLASLVSAFWLIQQQRGKGLQIPNQNRFGSTKRTKLVRFTKIYEKFWVFRVLNQGKWFSGRPRSSPCGWWMVQGRWVQLINVVMINLQKLIKSLLRPVPWPSFPSI